MKVATAYVAATLVLLMFYVATHYAGLDFFTVAVGVMGGVTWVLLFYAKL
jgi:hypothetical protein